VLDGWHRDTPQVLSQNWPVFSTGCYAQDSSVRTQVVDFRCTIEIGQVTVHDGDIIFGDIDGVLVIPKEVAEEVLVKALEKAAGEKKVRKAIEDGMSATEAFRVFGIL
jgi:regulator of RNase E activity RraA